jgi:hypothetical protein
MIKTHLDKIVDLGFVVDISWNSDFGILFYDMDILVLRAIYESKSDFEDFMEICIDMFYIWYNENYKLIERYEKCKDSIEQDEIHDKLEKGVLGHITKSVNRELLLNKLI